MNTAVDRILAIGRKPWMRRQRAPTFLFVDMAGYTALTEQRGDLAAAELARVFRRAMRALARKHGGWQVKSMGDGVMIWKPSPASTEPVSPWATLIRPRPRTLLTTPPSGVNPPAPTL